MFLRISGNEEEQCNFADRQPALSLPLIQRFHNYLKSLAFGIEPFRIFLFFRDL